MPKLNRRQFLSTAVVAALTPSLPAWAAQPARRVIIAGAGLAGLSAAYELAKAGYQVTVIEARTRAGGRVFTLRDQFADGLHVETGGEVVADGYKRFLAYCKEFHVAVDEVAEDGARSLATLLRGKLYKPGEAINPHPYGLTGAEALPPPQLLAQHLRAMNEEVVREPHKLAEFDKLSLAEALKARGISEQAIRLIDISLNYNNIEHVSAGGALWENKRRASGGTKVMRVRGGNSRLTDALAAAASRVGAQFVYGQAVMRVAHTDKGVLVWIKDAEVVAPFSAYQPAEKFQRLGVLLEAEHFISALPAATLSGVAFNPALPEEKQRAIYGLPYTRVTKIWLQARRAPWEEAGYGGGVWTDTELERVLALRSEPKSARGMFVVWLDGTSNLNYNNTAPDELDANRRVEWARQKLAEQTPQFAAAIEGGASVAWTKDPWARGAYAHFGRGQLTSLQPHLGAAVGRLHFAGEHTALNAPGMEGALESGARVVAEITGK